MLYGQLIIIVGVVVGQLIIIVGVVGQLIIIGGGGGQLMLSWWLVVNLSFLLTPSGEINNGLHDFRDRALKVYMKLRNNLRTSFNQDIMTS